MKQNGVGNKAHDLSNLGRIRAFL